MAMATHGLHLWVDAGWPAPPPGPPSLPAALRVRLHPYGEAIFCHICKSWSNGRGQYEEHMLGKKHRKNVRRSLLAGEAMQRVTFLLVRKWIREESYRREGVHIKLAVRIARIYIRGKAAGSLSLSVRNKTHFRRTTRPNAVRLPLSGRVAAVAGSDHLDVVETFFNAAWLSGPVGLLRSRVTQRGLLRIIDLPRAGAILKYELTNWSSDHYSLPHAVCSLCFAPDVVDMKDWELCYWCGDDTLCRSCTTRVLVDPTDPTLVGAYYSWAAPSWGPAGKRGPVLLRACALCISDHNLPTSTNLYRLWSYRALEQLTCTIRNKMRGYFHWEMLSTRTGRRRSFICSSVDVCTYRKMLREWHAVARLRRPLTPA